MTEELKEVQNNEDETQEEVIVDGSNQDNSLEIIEQIVNGEDSEEESEKEDKGELR